MKEFAREFERRAQDAEMAEEDAKVLLVGSLNKETLTRLDTYVTTRDPSTVTRKETIQERLRRVSYASMLSFLKQSNLTDLADVGAGGTKLPKQADKRGQAPSANQLGPAEQGPSGFMDSGIMAVTPSEGGKKQNRRRRKQKDAAGSDVA